jgi:hypothetical protein
VAKKDGWYSDRCTFGLHYDMHVSLSDQHIGERISVEDLVLNLKDMKCDWVQTDCKGHPGVTGWKSEVSAATVNPHIKKDMMEAWRTATHRLKLPLHCHYSGILDHAAGEKFPEWKVVPGPRAEKPPETHRMCPRSPYVDELVIPQMLELIDRYGVDGFWVDGDLWGVDACYCPKCRAAFTARTGIADPPAEITDAAWPLWMKFHRESFDEYVKKYCDAVHRHKPGVKVCSNWIQTFGDPGEPTAPTDWISGDNTWVFGMDSSRCEARFISTRGKPWDLMLWNFYCTGGFAHLDTQPWVVKPAEMLMQEAAVSLALGGHVQVYEATQYIRDGRLIPWRSKRIGEVAQFVKKRRALCEHTETIPQVAVLHSEHHYRSLPTRNLHSGADTDGVRGAVYSILEKSYGVDVLDEWALLKRLNDFPVIVVPEQGNLSSEMATKLKSYVEQGGRLLVTGADVYDKFGSSFLGASGEQLIGVEDDDPPQERYPSKNAHWCIPGGDEVGPIWSRRIRLLKPSGGKALCFFGVNPIPGEDLTPHPAAVIHEVGKGSVVYIPFDVFKYFKVNRYPFVREFIGEALSALKPSLALRVEAPVAVDVVLRKRGKATLVHFINRGSGIPNLPNSGAIDAIFPVGPMTVRMKTPKKPKKVAVGLEGKKTTWKFRPGVGGAHGLLTVEIPSVRIHEVLLIS